MIVILGRDRRSPPLLAAGCTQCGAHTDGVLYIPIEVVSLDSEEPYDLVMYRVLDRFPTPTA